MTQFDMIIRHLNDYGSIDDSTAYTEYGIRRLASRIYDLRKRGYDFDVETKKGKNRYGENTHYAVYRFKEENQ